VSGGVDDIVRPTPLDRIAALPLWHGEIDVTPLKGGLSNESYTVTDVSGRYVVRFGEDMPVHHVFRDHELMVARAAHAAGFSPAVVYAAPGVMVSHFIEGITYDAAAVNHDLAAIARIVRDFHERMPSRVSGPARLFWPSHVIRNYAVTLRVGEARHGHRLAGFLRLTEALDALQLPLPIVFGHHDLLPANFLHDGERLWLIDFEYAAFSTSMFDLAGVMANAGTDAPASREFLRCYFGHEPDEALLRSHAAMQCLALLREAMWSMVSELHMSVPDVDYVTYTEENLHALDGALENFRSRFQQRLPQP
jgi:thiamine kinase-like enzyme